MDAVWEKKKKSVDLHDFLIHSEYVGLFEFVCCSKDFVAQ